MSKHPCRPTLRPWIPACLLLLGACAAGPAPNEAAPPRDSQSLLAEGDSALQRGELPAAARAYRLAAEASADERVAEQAATMAFSHFQWSESLLAAERWLEINPTSEQARHYAAGSALALHRLDAAESRAAELVEAGFISPAAGFLALLPEFSATATAPDVTELFRRLAGRYPGLAEAQLALGSAALRSENFALAVESATRARAVAPYWMPPRMLEARARIAAGDEETGLAIARDSVMAPEADISTHLEYAALLSATGRDEEARAMLTPYVTGETVIPGALYTLGMLELQQDRVEVAESLFQQLLSTGAQSYDALYFLGVIAEKRGDEEAALRYFSRVEDGGRALSARQRVAAISAERDGVEAGLGQLEEFAATQPELAPEIVAAQAGLLSSLGEDERALATLDAGVARFPDSLDLRLARVFLLERSRRIDEAIRDLRELLARRPGDAMVQNALGYTLADHGRSLDEARELIASALEQMPDSAAVLDSMGWVLFRQGLLADSLRYLERASSLGSDPELELHLGEVQWAMGREGEARRTWAEALERHPGNERLEQRLEQAGP
ncbi:MAG TPA: tetratricopeptide repeat protein [Steroidobacteraceae bacterium]|nr:tetratricopeptide repeat protein [Steroidobacteraceae bacterium]